MANPFEDPDAEYLVLVNDEGQYSLWPAFAAVPDGWTVRLQRASRQECLDHISEHWTDMRPLSLQRAMGDSASLCRPADPRPVHHLPDKGITHFHRHAAAEISGRPGKYVPTMGAPRPGRSSGLGCAFTVRAPGPASAADRPRYVVP